MMDEYVPSHEHNLINFAERQEERKRRVLHEWIESEWKIEGMDNKPF